LAKKNLTNTGIKGALGDVSGNVTGVFGDIDDCEITMGLRIYYVKL